MKIPAISLIENGKGEWVYWVNEFNARSRLRKVGFGEDMNDLDALTAEYMLIISQEFDIISDERMKAMN